jgi:hypothetical protein
MLFPAATGAGEMSLAGGQGSEEILGKTRDPLPLDFRSHTAKAVWGQGQFRRYKTLAQPGNVHRRFFHSADRLRLPDGVDRAVGACSIRQDCAMYRWPLFTSCKLLTTSRRVADTASNTSGL